MRIVSRYSFNGGQSFITKRFKKELSEVTEVISSIDAALFKNKKSEEKTMPGKMLYAPADLNKAFKTGFANRGWHSHRVVCEYEYGEFLPGYVKPKNMRGAFREMDFVKPDRKFGG